MIKPLLLYAHGVTELAMESCTVAFCTTALLITTTLGFTVALIPLGNPVTARFTVPVNPFPGLRRPYIERGHLAAR